MSAVEGVVSDAITALRTGFDRSFAEPPRRHDEEYIELLAVRAGGRGYALRLSQTAGLHCEHSVTPLPGPLSALLGVAGFGGAIVPVYDLGALLGNPADSAPRWLVTAQGDPPVALAFAELDGHLRVPSETVVDEPGGPHRRDCLHGMVALPDGTRPVVDLPSVRAAVGRLAGHPNQES